MIGFLLRVHGQIIFLFVLLSSIPAIFIVTLGGKILGVVIISLLSSVLNSQLVSKKASPVYTSSILVGGILLVMCLLPGYVVVNVLGAMVMLALIILTHFGLGKYIKDR